MLQFVVLFAIFAIQAFAIPTTPIETPKTREVESQPQGPANEESHSGAAKDKRAVYYFTTSAVLPPYPATLYRYSYVPFYPAVPSPVLF